MTNPSGASLWENFNCFDSEITREKCQNISGDPENDYGNPKQNYHSIHFEFESYCVMNADDRAAGYGTDGLLLKCS